MELKLELGSSPEVTTARDSDGSYSSGGVGGRVPAPLQSAIPSKIVVSINIVYLAMVNWMVRLKNGGPRCEREAAPTP